MAITDKIKVLLAQRGKHFKDLAESVGMTQQGLRLSLKREKTSLDVLQKIADFLSVSLDFLISEQSNEVLPDHSESVLELKKVIQEKEELITLLKEQVNKILEVYFKFLANLNESDTQKLYSNNKLHNFEVELIIAIQEAFVMTAETKEEKAKHQKLIRTLQQKTSNRVN